jgi:hypothetical protein
MSPTRKGYVSPAARALAARARAAAAGADRAQSMRKTTTKQQSWTKRWMPNMVG